MVHSASAEEIIFIGCEIAMKINFYCISASFNGGEHLGVDQKVDLHHEFRKCDIHGTENDHNQFFFSFFFHGVFMAFSWNFNKIWLHSD